jgi:hypothetical protein
VAAVQGRVAQPRWQGAGGRQLVLPADQVDAELAEVGEDLGLAGVGEAAGPPLATDLDAVAAECLWIALPHQHGGMVAPAVIWHQQGPYDLQDLDPLLAQAPGVEHARAGHKVRIGQEGLHQAAGCSTGQA